MYPPLSALHLYLGDRPLLVYYIIILLYYVRTARCIYCSFGAIVYEYE
jgi:hypothetical protein